MLLQPSHVLPEFLIHLYFRHVDGVFAEENDSHELPLAPMLTPHHAVDQQECSGAEMALLSNECFNLNARREVERSEREGCKKSHFDSQEAVKIKRAALLQIENAVEEFRSKQKSLMEDSSERLLGIFRQFDERNLESPRPGPSPERRL